MRLILVRSRTRKFKGLIVTGSRGFFVFLFIDLTCTEK
jgi:hypothetical protein